VEAYSGPLSDPNAGFACGSVVHYVFFSGTSCTLCKMFLKKKKIFRPAGGDIPSRVSDRVRPVISQDVRGVHANGPLAPDNGAFRLRQHGTFLAFSGTCGTLCHMFRKKDVLFRPAGGESGRLSRQTPGWEPTA